LRLAYVALIGLVLFAEIIFLMVLRHVPMETLSVFVQLATILALVFPIYSWRKQRLDKDADLVDEVRVWSVHLQGMTFYLSRLAPSQAYLEVEKVQKLADETADKLAGAIARATPATSDLATLTYDLIKSLKLFALNKPRDGGQLLFDWEKIITRAHEVQVLATKEVGRFKIHYTVVTKIVVFLAVALGIVDGLLYILT
jgi:hypothetical protein